MNRLIGRVVGEAVSTGTAARADQRPPRPKPEIPPRPDTVEREPASSLADLEQRSARQVLSDETERDRVYAMWRSGNKYDACRYMLFSDFRYRDFVGLLYQLPEAEGLEMGGILDELAPPQKDPKYTPSDLVSAVAGAPAETARMRQNQPEQS